MSKTPGNKIGQSLAKTGDYIAANKKPLLYVGGAIVIVAITYFVVKRIGKGLNADKIIGGKFNEQNIDLTKTTITELTAKNYAENLFDAFNYYWGTDKSVIENVFSKITSEDFKMVYNAFGKRSYSSLNGGSPSEKWLAPDTWIGSVKIDLIGWLNEELDFFDGSLKNKIKAVIEPAGFVLES